MQSINEKLIRLFLEWSGGKPDSIKALPPAGSERRYFRIAGGGMSAIGAWNPDIEENEAFLYFTEQFHGKGLHVPAVYGIDPEKEVYLIEDFGDTSLFSMVESSISGSAISDEIIGFYKKSLEELLRFQVDAAKDLDFRFCYPYASFDRRSMKWDLSYFKYYFLKLHIPFHEGRLENDFDTLIAFLDQADSEYFMYRDFQSRNIFIKDNQPYFIDYQGGRKGPLQYDVASLLFQVKADLPFDIREELLDYYISKLSSLITLDKESFKAHYYGFVLIRLLQVLGAYGFRGIIEKKPHFLASIPFALKNIRWWLDNVDLQIDMPELIPALEKLARLELYQLKADITGDKKLTVSLNSFSYKHGIPGDLSGNGGGFVFDCRALPNPGREERYRAFNGKDQVVIDYLKDDPDVVRFLFDTEKIVSQSVDNYLARGFGHLAVNFGCTGGQHRSVYCTETMAKRLKERYPEVIFKVKHMMLNI